MVTTMDFNHYQLAYNVFYTNWKRFGIPEEDIPPPETEKDASLDDIIPGFSIAVALFQIASRKVLKSVLDDCRKADSTKDIYARLEIVMSEVHSEDVADSQNDTGNEDLSEDGTSEDISPDTMEEYVSEDSILANLPEDTKKILPHDATREDTNNDAMKEDTNNDAMKEDPNNDAMKEDPNNDAMKEDPNNDAMKEDPNNDAMKEDPNNDAMKEDPNNDAMKKDRPHNADMEEGLPGNKGCSEDISGLIAYSLAVCTELLLFERESEKNKEYMKFMPEMWKNYFDEHLKPSSKAAHCTLDHLKAYIKSVKCPEKFLVRFIAENKTNYKDIADKFIEYTNKVCAAESPEDSKSITEDRKLPSVLGMSFLKMKKRFTALKDICKCVKGLALDEIHLISPSSSNSTPTSPST